MLINLEDRLAEGQVDGKRHDSYTYDDKGQTLERSDQTCMNFLLQCGMSSGLLSPAISNQTVRQYLSVAEKKHLRVWPWHGSRSKKPWPILMPFKQQCSDTSLDITYAMMNPQKFQNGHKRYAKSKWKRFAYDDPTVMYHGNYLMVGTFFGFGCDSRGTTLLVTSQRLLHGTLCQLSYASVDITPASNVARRYFGHLQGADPKIKAFKARGRWIDKC